MDKLGGEKKRREGEYKHKKECLTGGGNVRDGKKKEGIVRREQKDRKGNVENIHWKGRKERKDRKGLKVNLENM